MTTAIVLLLVLVGLLFACALHWRFRVMELELYVACLVERLALKEQEMPPVELSRNPDGTWTARIFSARFTGNYEQCVAWLRANGEAF